jgi:GxxExxY protein
MKQEELTQKIIGVFYSVYNELGHGFLESVYEQAMILSLQEAGLKVDTQVAVPVWFHGKRIGDFRADIVVSQMVLLELKAIARLESSQEAQLLNYLRATDFEIGLLLNFGPKAEIKRRILDNDRKLLRVAAKKASQP